MMGSGELAALLVVLLSLLVKINTDGIEVLALRHEIFQVLTPFKNIIEVLMHDFFYFEKLFFYFHQFVGLMWILPFYEELFNVIIGQFAI